MNRLEAKKLSQKGRKNAKQLAIFFFMNTIKEAAQKGWNGVVIPTDKYDEDENMKKYIVNYLTNLGYTVQIKNPSWFLAEEYDCTEYHIQW